MEEIAIKDKALEDIKRQRKDIISRFAGDSYPKVDKPVSIFMAGSPGAGKTEFSKRFLEAFQDGTIAKVLPGDIDLEFTKVVRIDPDEIREMIPDYNGTNAYLFQGAASKGVAILIDYCHDKKKSYVLDGTLSKYEIALSNINRVLNRNRTAIIFYVYQDPFRAWEFTRQRERLEGRRIEKEIFINEFFDAKETVKKIKKQFGNRVQIWVIKRDYSNNMYEITVNVSNIDAEVETIYPKEELEKLL